MLSDRRKVHYIHDKSNRIRSRSKSVCVTSLQESHKERHSRHLSIPDRFDCLKLMRAGDPVKKSCQVPFSVYLHLHAPWRKTAEAGGLSQTAVGGFDKSAQLIGMSPFAETKRVISPVNVHYSHIENPRLTRL